MTDLQPVRGTRDLIGEDQRRLSHVIDTARRVAAGYGFDEWTTPIFEDTRVFARTLGETSDVVTKEMYTFTDRGGDSVTLRPENTAGICRALVSNGLTQSLPQKVFYAGPMFRYERPQKGRYRQFHQIGAELIGVPEPLADAEVIALGWDILTALGVGLWLSAMNAIYRDVRYVMPFLVQFWLFASPVVYSDREFRQVVGESYYIQLGKDDRFGWM